jgi:hypothetical protein
MNGLAASVPALLWRGELRVQGLLLRRPLVTVLQAVAGVAIFGIVALRTRDALFSTGPIHYLNVAILVMSIGILMAANVTLLGERTGTLPWQLQRWTAGLPLTAGQVARLIAAFSILRSGLLTLALLLAVAIGALTTAHSLTDALVIILSAVVLPLLPVALGLQWARRRGASVSFAFTLVPLALGVSAVTVPLPLTSGWVDSALRWISLPGMMLAGRADAVEAAVLLAGWAAVALVLMRPAALSLKDSLASRSFGSSVWRLGRVPASEGRWSLAFDIAVHRVGLGDLLEILFLGAASCSVVALQVFASGTLFMRAAMVAAFSMAAAAAGLAGYVQMRSTIRADDAAEAWLRALPMSRRDLSAARHAVCVAGALLAIVPVVVLAVIRGGPVEPVAVAVWLGLSVWALTGWFAAYLPASGLKKYIGGYALFSWFATRTAIGAAIIAWHFVPAVAGLVLIDFAIGLTGQWRGARADAP